jgi:hypothetical protein
MKNILQALLLSCAILSTGARATSFATDASDLWYVANESGWGLSVNQQDSTLFAVLFVYDEGGRAAWYVAPAMRFVGTTGGIVYTGELYQTTGPFFGAGVFNPNAVTTRQVGTATFALTNLTTANFSYSVDNRAIAKTLTRQTWAIDNLSGNYLGGRVGTYAGCPAGGLSGYVEEPGTWSIQHGGPSATLTFTGTATTCTYNGAHAQSGHFAQLSGNFSCSNGQAGNFQAFELNPQLTALAGRISTIAGNGCTYEGRVGGLRRSP